jgi:hypothetical protein
MSKKKSSEEKAHASRPQKIFSGNLRKRGALEDTPIKHGDELKKYSSPQPYHNHQKNVILTILKFPE